MSNKRAWTPGPWTVRPIEEPYDPYEIVSSGGRPRLITSLWQDDAPLPDFNSEQRANARLIAAAPDLYEALDESDWQASVRTPGFCGSTAIRVLVRVEKIDNPPALNAPDRYAFGHRIVSDNPHAPPDGWYFDGQNEDERVVAWRFIDPPKIVRDALAKVRGDG